jgi:uncharacterized membrane protein
MSDLIVVGFEQPDEADKVLLKLAQMKKEYLIDLEDAVVVVRDEAGKVHLKQSLNLTAVGAVSGLASGGFWGALVGLLFLNPLAGFAIGGAIGAGTGALSGSLTDYGIDDNFIKSLGDTIPVNSSALFVLVRKAQPDKVLAELAGIQGKVLRTSLSNEQEARLQEALSKATRAEPAVAGGHGPPARPRPGPRKAGRRNGHQTRRKKKGPGNSFPGLFCLEG